MFQFAKTITVAAGVLLTLGSASHAQVIYGQENSNLKRANAAMMAGEFESASKYFRRAVRANLGQEKLISALNNYCAVEYAVGNMENAEEVCSNAIKNDRRYWRAYVNRGNVRAALGKLELAKSDYERAVELKPNSGIANRALASFQNSNGTLFAEARN